MSDLVLTASLVVYKPDFFALGKTLNALQQAFIFAKQRHRLRFELTLVDNSNDPAWAKLVESWVAERSFEQDGWKLGLLNPNRNLGYGRGNNLVIDRIESDYHLVINPDLFVELEALHQALDFMQSNPDMGLLVPAVFGEDGQREYLCKRHPTLAIMFLRSFSPQWLRSSFRYALEKFEMQDHDYEKTFEDIEYPTGCYMFFRTRSLQEIKGFDSDYFLHYEDADIGRRLSMIAKIAYVPTVKVIHRWARGTHNSWRMRLITVRSGLIYWSKWGGIFKTKNQKTYTKYKITPIKPVQNSIGGKVLVTGATGFIGRRLCERLLMEGYGVRGAVRRTLCPGLMRDVERVDVGALDQNVDWSSALLNVDSIVHLAARVHVMREFSQDPLAEFRKINVAPTIDLARQAARAGVRRFIFISSIKVNGESTPIDRPFTADDTPAPVDPYGISKYEAELGLAKVAEETGMELVILRPVIVYGAGVSGNFMELMGWLDKGLPLPFSLIKNRRSLVAVDNLVDFILTCLKHPKAANQTFLVSDGVDLSTPELLKLTTSAMSKNIRLIPVPVALLKGVGLLIGMDSAMKRLCESLCVDISKNRELLGWTPPDSVEHSLEETVMHYLACCKH